MLAAADCGRLEVDYAADVFNDVSKAHREFTTQPAVLC
jgi:hypothetical protein